MNRRPVAVVGSGFAGSLLARLLASRGCPVILIERGAHPRFALGESSTPLAAICLERLARRYAMPDLEALAAHGRGTRELPALGRGLKRGFTFYAHRAGRRYENDAYNSHRLLVAASPNDEVADVHWLRSDVDAYLVARAVEAGAEYIDGCRLAGLRRTGSGWRLAGERRGCPVTIEASFVVDASGAGRFLEGALDPPPRERRADPPRPGPGRGVTGAPRPDTGLVFGHFECESSFVEAASSAAFPASPYPEERAAVHHLLEEGWMYVLRFDDGVVSAGFVLDRGHPDVRTLLEGPPEAAWTAMLDRYPTLGDQFAGARPTRPIGRIGRLRRRAARASGTGWALLPHTFAFTSPMFSTGIAWGLSAVERLAAILGDASGGRPDSFALDGYGRLLETEGDAIDAFVAPAYALRDRFDAFVAWTRVYFAAASYHEACQRLCPRPRPDGWPATGFLGATDPAIRRAFAAAPAARLAAAADPESIVRELIRTRDVAGLGDPPRRRAIPVDLEALVRHAALLGLDEATVRAALPRLRGRNVPSDRRNRDESGHDSRLEDAASR